MLPSLNGSTTYAGAPGGGPGYQHHTHVPQRQRRQAGMHVHHRHTHQLHCIECKSGGGVDQRHSALARCLADLVTTHTGAKVHIEQTIPGIPREPRGASCKGTHGHRVSTCTDRLTLLTRRWSHLSQPMRASLLQLAPAQATWLNARKRKIRQIPQLEPCPIHPGDHRTTWLPRTKVHQILVQRH